jgi:hypothetical protein
VERVKGYVATSVLCITFLFSAEAFSCTLAPGYFHQVTAIRGRVVGKNLGPFDFRWLRRRFSVGNATLSLYEYRWPAKLEDRKRIAIVKSDSDGNFDFGNVAPAHYSLVVEVPNSDSLGAWSDVEITDKVRPTKTVLLDVSPIHPGGNEFIETKTTNASSH